MVAGLKFLSKKSFNPQNEVNQKRVWERQQEKKVETRRLKERQKQLQSERDDEELAKARGDLPKLGFMYAPPPGMQGIKQESKYETATATDDASDDDKKPAAKKQKSSDNATLVQRQPGDDDAAAAFRLMLAGPTATDESEDAADQAQVAVPDDPRAQASFRGMGLQGSSVDADRGADTRNALEKAVGRKAGGSSSLTLDEQVQRFPTLANAPRAKGMSATDIGVSFKPLGTQIRNVRCMRCQQWGHSKGDRECELEWDPFSGKPAPTLAAREPERARGAEIDLPRRGRDARGSSSSDDSSSKDSRRERKRRKEHHKSKRRKDSKHRKRSRSHDSGDRDRDRDRDRSRSKRKKSHKSSRKEAR